MQEHVFTSIKNARIVSSHIFLSGKIIQTTIYRLLLIHLRRTTADTFRCDENGKVSQFCNDMHFHY